MNWYEFGYAARRLSQDSQYSTLKDKENFITSLEHPKQDGIYHESFKKSRNGKMLIPYYLLKKAANHSHSALETYSKLDLSKLIQNTVDVNKRFSYLALVVIVFIFMTMVFQNKIIPDFTSFHYEMLGEHDSLLLILSDYYTAIILSTILIMLGLLVSCIRLKNLLNFKYDFSHSRTTRWLVFPSIWQTYNQIIETLRFPTMDPDTKDLDSVSSHLKNADHSGLNLAAEINYLLDYKLQKLSKLANLQINALLAFVGFFIAFNIAFYLYAFYSPLFQAGSLS